jgi:hypothetical protein
LPKRRLHRGSQKRGVASAAPHVASISIIPEETAVSVGSTIACQATFRDADGNDITQQGRISFFWDISQNPSRATIVARAATPWIADLTGVSVGQIKVRCRAGSFVVSGGEIDLTVETADVHVVTAEANGPYAVETGQPLTPSSAGSNDSFGSWTKRWDWGDGTNTGFVAANATPSKSYPSAGTRTITLTIKSDTDGQEATDVAQVSVTDPAPTPPPSLYPHQPAGHTRLREHACDTMGSGGTTPDTFHYSTDLAGHQWSWYVWTSYTRSGLPKFQLLSEPGTPRGDTFLRTMLWGIGFAEVEFAPVRWAEQRELYMSMWARAKRNADGGWWVHPTGDKILGFFHYADAADNSDNNGILACAGPGGAGQNHLITNITYGVKQQDNVARNTYMGSPLVPLDQWNQLEWIFKLNTLGQANGVLQLWITPLGGTSRLAINRSDMTYITAGKEAGFLRYKLRAMHGGTNTPTPPNPDYIDLAHIYISGIPK